VRERTNLNAQFMREMIVAREGRNPSPRWQNKGETKISRSGVCAVWYGFLFLCFQTLNGTFSLKFSGLVGQHELHYQLTVALDLHQHKN